MSFPEEEEDLRREIREVKYKLEDLEGISEVVDRMIETVGEMKGKLDLVATQLTAHLTSLEQAVRHGNESTDKLASWKTALTFASAVVVPLLIALIGGYFALKSASSK